ncbi:hypothetical protein OHA72_32465 [Dactylosporangium sp. NBC_01737]|uniref:hypothetical protein n=1 Tax=Dactylosporangium sp. NBC_01737 TaxID=2975959 RepID=UPI002E12CAB5|nr:hypothetical protein OHA72_32465 [Dactylosporangium sp. NBC_01737]
MDGALPQVVREQPGSVTNPASSRNAGTVAGVSRPVQYNADHRWVYGSGPCASPRRSASSSRPVPVAGPYALNSRSQPVTAGWTGRRR